MYWYSTRWCSKMYSQEPKKWYLLINRLRWQDNIQMYLEDVRTCKVVNTEETFPERLSKRVKTDTYLYYARLQRFI